MTTVTPSGRSHLESEIREQPNVIARFLNDGLPDVSRVARVLGGRGIRYVLIAARGSSDNAARYGQYLFGERMRLPVALAAPSLESLYGAGAVPHERGGLVIAISQSGRSPDIVSVVTAARARGAATAAITNDAESPLAAAAEFTIALHAGVERSVAATKTYTASLAALAALVTELRDDERDRTSLRTLPIALRQGLNSALTQITRLDHLARGAHTVTVGRGYNYATAMEIALKLRELTATIAEGFSAADLMHGPIAAITPDTRAVIVAAPGPTLTSIQDTAAALERRGARTITIGPRAAGADLILPDDIPEWLTPIVGVVPGQLLALRWAQLAGQAIDEPGSLTKVTHTL
jgi:glucosamine--fructose-6-phosphate aminotransferase (isomerizing)